MMKPFVVLLLADAGEEIIAAFTYPLYWLLVLAGL
jgi:hypothetical protein